MGVTPVSLRGAGPWRGRSTRATVDRGDARHIKIENGYVSGDGHEVRQFPGYKTILDLSEVNNPDGFTKFTWDLWLPYYRDVGFTSPADQYYFQHDGSPVSEVLSIEAFARPVHVHGFEQVRGKLLMFGESDERKMPFFAAGTPRNQLFIRSVAIINAGGGIYYWELTFSQTEGGLAQTMENPLPVYGTTNSSPVNTAGLHAVTFGDVMWIELLTVDPDQVGDPVTQAMVDATVGGLNNKFHRITSLSLGRIRLDTVTPVGVVGKDETSALTGRPYKTRHNKSGLLTPGLPRYVRESPNGGLDQYDNMDDPDALTVWNVSAALDTSAPLGTAYASWVANRMRDYGDTQESPLVEGAKVNAGTLAGISRRRQRTLDYRLNPEVAGNRLLLAAPGYGCIFQAPLVVPNDGDEWPAYDPDNVWSPGGGQGILAPYNDLHDKPRCLGVPKGAVVESFISDVIASPTASNLNFNVTSNLTVNGFPGGETYRLAISYQDEYTGEEGLASEPMTFVLPAYVGSYVFNLRVWHPGYYMPECLALKVNIYIGIGASGPLGYYQSVPMRSDETGLTAFRSAKYGLPQWASGAEFHSPAVARLVTKIRVPEPKTPGDIASLLDFTRLAPSINQMPMGAECVRSIRGIALSVGHTGTHGLRKELRYARLSSLYEANDSPIHRWIDENTLVDRAFTDEVGQTSEPVKGTISHEDGSFGTASGYFPPAYQGSRLWAFDLFPAPRQLGVVDKVGNFKSSKIVASQPAQDINRDAAHAQRLEMTEPLFDPTKKYKISPADPGLIGEVVRPNRESYHVLDRGQIQVSEPGRPDIAAKTQIQFMDPNNDDDGVAIGNIGGAAVICSKRETFLLNWHRAPQGQVPQLLSKEFGCIATNSMVEFDGGLAWISARGPVAMSGGVPQFVGEDLEDDFHGARTRYLKDSQGMMRHCWGAHDKARGLVMWGMVSEDSTHTVAYEGVSNTFEDSGDKARSRFPCDEVLIWSYKANAFSYWRPPAGLEVLWMRPITNLSGETFMAFLAADLRIYVLDDIWQDTNASVFRSVMPDTRITGQTTFQSSVAFGMDRLGSGGGAARGTGDNLLREGMLCLLVSGDTSNNGVNYLKYKDKGRIVSATVSTLQVNLDTAWEWEKGDIVLIGVREPMVLQTTYHGEALKTIDLDAIQMRHAIVAPDSASPSYAAVKVRRTAKEVIEPREPEYTKDYELLGRPLTTDRTGYRRSFGNARAQGPEISVEVEVLGAAQVRVTDLLAEMGNAG